MITAFGKFLRILRMDNGEILKTMAEKLEVTSSFLSCFLSALRPPADAPCFLRWSC